MIRWFKNLRRHSVRSAYGREILNADVAHYRQLSPVKQQMLCELTQLFVSKTRWEGCAGLTVTFDMQVVIAAQACLLLLGLDYDYYRHVRLILVYPDVYRGPIEIIRPLRNVIQSDVPRQGEAWFRGPVVLSWASALAGSRNAADGHNVVIHEFAHKLDFHDGRRDGAPLLPHQAAMRWWRQVMTTAYEKLIDDAERGRATLLDKYGATNPREFFAVATEAFFERPRELQRTHTDVYNALRGYFAQDLASWRLPY